MDRRHIQLKEPGGMRLNQASQSAPRFESYPTPDLASDERSSTCIHRMSSGHTFRHGPGKAFAACTAFQLPIEVIRHKPRILCKFGKNWKRGRELARFKLFYEPSKQ